METKEERHRRIEKQMLARRDREQATFSPDQSKPGWSEGMTWQEILDSRGYPNLNVKNL